MREMTWEQACSRRLREHALDEIRPSASSWLVLEPR
jgi:hypothetical protein